MRSISNYNQNLSLKSFANLILRLILVFIFMINCKDILPENLSKFQSDSAHLLDEVKNVKDVVEWKLVKRSNDIILYERWIPLPDSRKTRERKGVFYVSNSIDEIVNLVVNENGIKSWMPKVQESKSLAEINQNQQIIYLFFNAPWPFKDKDLVAKITVKETSGEQVIAIHYSAISNYIPLNENAERLTSYEATWTITSEKNGLTEVAFTAYSDTPLVAPRWIQDPITEKLFKNNLQSLRKQLIHLNSQS